MRQVEEVILKKKGETELGDVTFVPPKFGAYTLSCMVLGFGLGIMVNHNYLFGSVNIIIGIIAMAYVYSKRGQW